MSWRGPSSGSGSRRWRHKSVEELGLTADQLVADYGPDQPVPVPAEASADKWAALRAPVDDDGKPVVEGKPFVREEQEKRLRKAERDLSSLGKVNPLALEEFAALEETAPVPQHPAGGPESQPQGPAGHHQGSRRPRAEGLRGSLRGHLGAVRAGLRPALSRRRRPAGPDRPRRHADHRHRGRSHGPPARKSSGSRCCPAANGR